MQRSVYEDNKYSMQDTATLYIGSKYTLGELLEEEDILFKFRLVVERYLLPEADAEDTLETHLYYLDAKSFLVKIYRQLKARVKVNQIEERKSLTGKRKKEYVTKVYTVEQLAKLTLEQKEQKGIVVQELMLSKLALMVF